jgi:very-short-patch-repair endonuclease
MPPTPRPGAQRPGGGAGAAALRARIEAEGFAGYTGPDAYKAYMRSLRKKAPAELAAIGGRACHRALLQQLGEDGYRDRQRAGFEAACHKHGREKITGQIARAHAERRTWRLAHPTPAEAALQHTLEAIGFTIHPLTHEKGDQGFEYRRWRREGSPPLSRRDVIVEARVGPYFVDALLPELAVAFEVDGGVHLLRPDYDAQRRRWLEGQGLTVHAFPNKQALEGLGETFAGLLAL